MSHQDDDHFEPVPGLPEELPEGESILWQGAPDWRALAVDVFHVRAVALYSALMLSWHFASLVYDGAGVASALASVAMFAILPVIALVLLASFARMTAGTTLYTITDRRLVMRIGIVLTMSVNIPFRIVQSAATRTSFFGTTGIAVTTTGSGRVSYLHLWPHARPWKMAEPEPMMRCLPDGEAVADLFARALAADNARRAVEAGEAAPATVRVKPKPAPNQGHGRPATAAG